MHLLMLKRKLGKLCFTAAWLASSACGLHRQHGNIIRAIPDYLAASTARSADTRTGVCGAKAVARKPWPWRESRGVKAVAVA